MLPAFDVGSQVRVARPTSATVPRPSRMRRMSTSMSSSIRLYVSGLAQTSIAGAMAEPTTDHFGNVNVGR